MNQELIKLSLEKGILLDKEVCNILSDLDSPSIQIILEKISHLSEKFITKSFILKNVERLEYLINNENLTQRLKIKLGLTFEISNEKINDCKIEKKEDYNFDDIKVLSSPIINVRKIEPQDFVKYFRIRYNEMRSILIQRKELENLVSINKMDDQRQSLSIIAMVFSKKISKNKNIILEVEDLTGKTKVLISKDKDELYEKAKDIIIDDIIGIKGFGNGEIIFANDIFFPDSYLKEKTLLEEDKRVAFISDIHVGSKLFLKKNFEKFIKWVNGEIGDEVQRAEALRVKYLLLTGDNIDGVSVYPGQEELLEIKDIKEQYNQLANYLSQIRKDIRIVICPGQHDAVRIAEPQPPIGNYFAEALHKIPNLILVSNPSIIELGCNGKKGVKILMYHGASMNSYSNEIESLRTAKPHDNPSKVVKEMLKRRHLCSIHSSVTYIPDDKTDSLLIHEIPDIVNTADFHKTDINMYNNILIICDSCWQSITPFEEKVGNHPDPCKVPVLNLKTRELKILDFSEVECQ